jgi:hypothetical protein
MDAREAVEVVYRCRMSAKALYLIGTEDMRETCVEELWRQTLLRMSEELEEAEEALRAHLDRETQREGAPA